MKPIPELNTAQQWLVEEHLDLVKGTIRSQIAVNENLFGFEYDDLFQEGCLWLCKAAVTYDAQRGTSFETFARRVISNGLKTYCRLMCGKQKRLVTIPLYFDPEHPGLAMEQFPDRENWEDVLSMIEIQALLETLKQQYKGTTRLGIEAIGWKVKGYSGTEIARMYGVKPNFVGAWISRAVGKLKQNRMFSI